MCCKVNNVLSLVPFLTSDKSYIVIIIIPLQYSYEVIV